MKPKGIRKRVSGRIAGLGIVIFALFSVILLRLVYLQVFSYNTYTEKKDDYTSIRQYSMAPRGQIYDCKGNVLAKTVVSHNIVYTSPNGMTYDDYQFYADRIVSVFDIDPEGFSQRDKQEAYVTWCSWLEPDDAKYQAKHMLTQKELQSLMNGTMSEQEKYSILMSRIGEDEIKEIPEKDLKKAVVYQRMISQLSTGQESVIVEDVDDGDVAYLVEHKTEFPGFDVDFGGWKREYPYGETLSDVIGTVSTSTEGLPAESADYYQSKGYQLNAPVGKSGLEYQYNDLLTGTEQISIITYDSNGLARAEVIQQAKAGYDLVISIDIDLQQYSDEVVKSVLSQNAYTYNRENFGSLFFCTMDPNTGEVKSLSGYQEDKETKKMTYFASGNYNSLVNPGSSIKGATVYMGLAEGVVQPDTVVMDEVWNIGGQQFASFETHGPVNAEQALSVSSNIYMFNIALRLAGTEYHEGMALDITDPLPTFIKMRRYYSMFGLGSKTGLDVPDEVAGYSGAGNSPGLLLNYSIGQYDMYTPIQLLQYVSVIASDGRLYQPRLFEYAYEVNSEQIVDILEKSLKSTLPEETEEALETVQKGMRACVAQGNCGDPLLDMSEPMAAKTGTAEVGEWTTAILVGFGPYSDPSIAFACAAPTSSVNSQNVAENICSYHVAGPIMEKYFELYPEKGSE